MKKCAAFLAAFLLWACAPKTVLSPSYDFSQMDRIGIMAFSNAWADLNGVENLFAKYLIRSGFKVVERAQLESILREHNISVSGYLSPDTTREIGRILGVDVLLIGEVSSYTPARTELTLTSSRRTESRPVMRQDVIIDAKVALIAKLVDVETAEIVWIGSDSEESSLPLDAADYLARKLVKSFTKELAKREKQK